jgi:hypothetical protein
MIYGVVQLHVCCCWYTTVVSSGIQFKLVALRKQQEAEQQYKGLQTPSSCRQWLLAPGPVRPWASQQQ